MSNSIAGVARAPPPPIVGGQAAVAVSDPLPPGPIALAAAGGRDTLETLERVRARYGDLVRLARPGAEVWLVAGPGLARAVLAERPQDFGKGARRRGARALHAVLGGGLLTAPDDGRRLRRRRTLQPAFSRARIDALVPAASSLAADRVDRWLRTSARAGAVDVYPELEELAARLTQRLLFGRELDSAASRALRLPLALGAVSMGRARAARAAVDAVLTSELARRAAEPMPAAVQDALGLLLGARHAGRIDDAGILDELATLTLAGIETSASAAAFALSLLARDHAVQRDVAADVARSLRDRPPTTAADLRRLPAVAAAFDESLRLFPPVPAAPRQALRDSLLGGRLVPAGTRLLVSIHTLHRHPDYWRDPAAFRPHRFLDGDGGPARAAFLPFGAGTHLCLGRELATMLGRLVIASCVQRAVLSAPEDEPLRRKLAVGLTPASGTRLTLAPRGAGRG
ncbi:MAG: cytochrome P450 [Deinococcales bacterium]